MHKGDKQVCAWMSIDEYEKYIAWKDGDGKRTSEPTVEELIEKARKLFTEVQMKMGYVDGLTELGCSLEAAYRKERAFFEEECRKSGLIIDDLRRQMRDFIEELDERK